MEIKKWHYSRSMDGLFTKQILLNIQSYHFSHPGEFKRDLREF